MQSDDLPKVLELIVVTSVVKQDVCVGWRGDGGLLQELFVLSYFHSFTWDLLHRNRRRS